MLTATLAPDPVSFLGPVIEGTYRGAVDTFTDNRANAGVADLTANISWGDGSPNTAGTIIALGGGKFEVDGTHVFQAGTYNPTVSISDTAANLHETAVLPSSSVLHVLDGSLVAGPVTVAPIGGVPFDGPLATFRDSSSLSQASDFTAVIDWGDGTPDSVGTVSGAAGQFTVSGGHTYADPGASALRIRVSSSEDESLLITNTTGRQATAPMPIARVDGWRGGGGRPNLCSGRHGQRATRDRLGRSL